MIKKVKFIAIPYILFLCCGLSYATSNNIVTYTIQGDEKTLNNDWVTYKRQESLDTISLRKNLEAKYYDAMYFNAFRDDSTYVMLNFKVGLGDKMEEGRTYEMDNFVLNKHSNTTMSLSTFSSNYCDKLKGKFHVIEAKYDAQGELVKAAVDFMETCEETSYRKSLNGGPAFYYKNLHGSLRYNSDVPVSLMDND